MKALRIALAIAAVLVAGLTVIAAPAMATPTRTDSVGSQPTAPFFTPIGNTRSESTGVGGPFTWGVLGLGLQVQCPITRISGYVGETHTQFRITNFSVGDGVGACPVMPGGWTLDGNQFTCTATSVNPWLFHITRINAADPNSVTGTLNNTSTCRFTLTNAALRASCVVTIDINQSMRGRYTQVTTSLTIAELNLTSTIRNGVACPWVGSWNSQIAASWTLRPDTARDPRIKFTDLS